MAIAHRRASAEVCGTCWKSRDSRSRLRPHMPHRLLQLVLLFSLIFQGVVVVGAVAPGGGPKQHCAEHSGLHQEHCPCCPEGATSSASCTVQCSVAQASIALFAPAWLT